MRQLLPLFIGLHGCSVRHLDGHDRYSEVCVDGTVHLLLELGNQELDCESTGASAGQLQLQFNLSEPFVPPIEIEFENFSLAQWCGQDAECIGVTAGSLLILAYEEGIAMSGSYAFELNDGTRIEGEHGAQLCDMEACP